MPNNNGINYTEEKRIEEFESSLVDKVWNRLNLIVKLVTGLFAAALGLGAWVAKMEHDNALHSETIAEHSKTLGELKIYKEVSRAEHFTFKDYGVASKPLVDAVTSLDKRLTRAEDNQVALVNTLTRIEGKIDKVENVVLQNFSAKNSQSGTK